MKILNTLLGSRVRKVVMQEEVERDIVYQMSKIEGIEDYFELLKQAGYQLFGRTKEERYLGWVAIAEHVLNNIGKIKVSPDVEEVEVDSGYQSTVE